MISTELMKVLKPLIKYGLSEAEGTRFFDDEIRPNKAILQELVDLDIAPPAIAFFLKLHSMKSPKCPSCGTEMSIDCPAAACPNRKCADSLYINIPESEKMCEECISYKMRKCILGIPKETQRSHIKLLIKKNRERK